MLERNTALHIGIIGCGGVTESRHLPTLMSLPQAKVVAVADVNPQRLERIANRFGIVQRYADYHALLADPAIEAVAVCVPTQFHLEVALAALEAKKHLLIEKPLTLCLEESDRLMARAEHVPQRVMVGFNMRWHRLVRQAREMIQQGCLGPLELIRTVFTSSIRHRQLPAWRTHRATGGGVLIETAVHHFYLWRFLLQSEVEEVFAMSQSEVWDDTKAIVTARLANGMLATATFSQSTSENHELDIYGQAGRLQVSCYRFHGLAYVTATPLPWSGRARWRRAAQRLRTLPEAITVQRQGGDYLASFRGEWQHFIHAIQCGSPVESTLAEGRSALQVALAAVESAALRKPVYVAQASGQILQ